MVGQTTCERITLHRQINSTEQLQYLEVPFEIQEDVCKIQVKYSVINESEQECVVDLGVRDPLRVRGWSGGAREEFYISLHDATPGYIPGNLVKGSWAVLLGAYKIPKNGCKVEITILFEKEIKDKHIWLKGDLHMHTVHSDGAYTLEEATEIAINKGLDFIALTDHNTVSQNFTYPKTEKIICIPGMELTTYFGHCNFYGVKDPVLDFRAVNIKELINRIKEAIYRGAKVSINHPHDSSCPWEWGWSIEYDWVEVWNGPWRNGNKKTLEWWQNQLVNGRKITVVGGSDTHRPDPYVQHGMPTTWVKCTSRSQEAVLASIDQGNVFISYSPEGPIIDIKCGQKTMGDTVTEISYPVEFIVTGVHKGDEIKIITEKGNEYSFIHSSRQETFEHIQDINGNRFFRIEVWRYFPEVKEMLMAAMSNPIYVNIEGN